MIVISRRHDPFGEKMQGFDHSKQFARMLSFDKNGGRGLFGRKKRASKRKAKAQGGNGTSDWAFVQRHLAGAVLTPRTGSNSSIGSAKTNTKHVEVEANGDAPTCSGKAAGSGSGPGGDHMPSDVDESGNRRQLCLVGTAKIHNASLLKQVSTPLD